MTEPKGEHTMHLMHWSFRFDIRFDCGDERVVHVLADHESAAWAVYEQVYGGLPGIARVWLTVR